MNIKSLSIALGLALTAFTFNANAQKAYTEGVAVYKVTTARGDAEAKLYFNADSSALVTNGGAFTSTVINNTKGTFMAILVNVPVMSIKRAAVLTPDELDQGLAMMPKFTFTPTTETKVINGFNCKKVIAKDSKSGANYDTWVTNDISVPASSLTKAFADAGGVPVQFTSVAMGQTSATELKSISADKPAKGIFGIPAGYDKISLDDLKSMGGK